MRFFLILNSNNFVPLTAHIKLEIYYSYELDNTFSQEVSILALNDKFAIQEINFNKKDFSYNIKPKELEACWSIECA